MVTAAPTCPAATPELATDPTGVAVSWAHSDLYRYPGLPAGTGADAAALYPATPAQKQRELGGQLLRKTEPSEWETPIGREDWRL